jgi:hypothetical protein
MHMALADFDQTVPRHMLRTTLLGEPSASWSALKNLAKAEPPGRSLVQRLIRPTHGQSNWDWYAPGDS